MRLFNQLLKLTFLESIAAYMMSIQPLNVAYAGRDTVLKVGYILEFMGKKSTVTYYFSPLVEGPSIQHPHCQN